MLKFIRLSISILCIMSIAVCFVGCRQQNKDSANSETNNSISNTVTSLNETAPEQVASKKIVLPDQFPIAMTFKSFIGYTDVDLPVRIKDHEPFPIIHQPMDSCFDAVRKAYPDKIITKQDAYGGTVSLSLSEIWPGHLLYKPGTKLTKNCTAQDTVLYIDDYKCLAKSQTQIDRTNKRKTPYYLILYALDEKGRPDWSKAEHIVLTGFDAKNNSITVKRAQLGTAPLSLQAGEAVVAAHMMFWENQWQLNLSLHSPRGGPDNLTAAEWFARKITKVIEDSKADGVEFDVGRWTWGHPEKDPMDADNDLIADYGYIDGVNSFGLGGQVLFRELRKLMGPDKIIQVDSNSAVNGPRGWQYLNGVQLESFPKENHYERFSEAFFHLRTWAKQAETLPRFSYGFTKTPTTLFALDRHSDGSSTDYRFRVGLAAACIVGMPHPFANLTNIKFDPENPAETEEKNKEQEFGVFKWDEYFGGDLNNWQWLGRPTGEAYQVLENIGSENLLEGVSWEWKLEDGFEAEYKATDGIFSATVKKIPANVITWTNLNYPNTNIPQTKWFGVRLAPEQNIMPEIEPGKEYTIVFEARGDDKWDYMGQIFEKVPRMIAINGIASYPNNEPTSVLAEDNWKTYRMSIIADEKQPSELAFGVAEQIGTTDIRNIRLYKGGAECWVREFEKGIVLLNMTKQAWQYKLNGTYRRIKGTQCPEVNNGEQLSGTVTVPAWDALFLFKQ